MPNIDQVAAGAAATPDPSTGSKRPEDSVFTLRPEAEEMAQRLRLVRALRGGTQAMRDAGEDFLPRFGKETQTRYEARLKASFLFPAYGDALDKHAAQVFSEPIRLLEDAPDELKSWESNVDGQGGSLNAWAPEVFKAGEDDGLIHVLADRASESEIDGERSQPYLTVIRADALIWWSDTYSSHGYELTEIRFRCDDLVPVGASGFRKRQKVRIVRPGVWEEWERESEGAEETKVAEGTFGLDYIPLSTFYASKAGPMVAYPFLEALAHKNVEHWQLSSLVSNFRNHTLVPFRKFIGVKESTFQQIGQGIGSDLSVHSEAEPGKTDIGWVSADVPSLTAGREELERIEEQMRELSKAPMVSRRSGSVTATERSISSAEAATDVQALAIRFEDFLNSAFQDLAAWWDLEVPDEGLVEVHKDFRVSVDSSDIEHVFTALDKHIIDDDATFYELQRRDTLSEKHKVAEVLARAREGSLDRGLGAGVASRERLAQMLERVAAGESPEAVLDGMSRLTLVQSVASRRQREEQQADPVSGGTAEGEIEERPRRRRRRAGGRR